MSFRSSIFNNPHLKVAALIVGIVLWTFAKGEQEGERLFLVPLVLRNVPEGLTTVEVIPENVSVLLTGDNKELVRLDLWGEPYAIVDMTGAQADRTFRVSMSSANIVLPRDSKVQVVEVRDPKNLDLEIDRLIDRRVRVEPMVEGEPAPGFFVLGSQTSLPDSVFVFGPESIVSELTAVRTAVLNISGRRNRVDAARAIESRGAWNLHAVPKEVRVVVDIEGTRMVTLSDVPLVFEHELGFTQAAVSPYVVDLTLSGPEHLALSLTSSDVVVAVDAMGLPRGTHDLVPEVLVPEGMELHGVEPSRVTATLQ